VDAAAPVARLARAHGCVATLQAVLDAGGLDAIVNGLRCEHRLVVLESIWAGANLCSNVAPVRVPELCASELLSALAGECGLPRAQSRCSRTRDVAITMRASRLPMCARVQPR
jgi:hypothetical protein